MVYTSYEMIQDCRAGKPEGWRHFIANYLPVIQKLLAHYAPGAGQALTGQVLLHIHNGECALFESLQPVPERWFIAELRQRVLAELNDPPVEIRLELDTLAQALGPLTLLEKQAAWAETMGYDAATTGAMLRMAPETVDKVRLRAAELLRGVADAWRRTLLAENGRTLGREASAAATPDCQSSKVFLDILDGRSSWNGRESVEQHVGACWRCIDHFVRMAEVVELIRGLTPLSDTEASVYCRLLGVESGKKSFWRRA